MRKVISILLSAISIITLILAVGVLIYGIVDIQQTLTDLNNTPGTSGVDYLGLGWAHSIVLFFVSFFGLAVSIIALIMTRHKVLRWLFGIAIFLFAMLTVASFFVFNHIVMF